MSRKDDTRQPKSPISGAPELDGYIRQSELLELVPVDRGTIRRWEKKGLFPKRCQLGPGSIGWPRRAVKAWQDARAGI